MPRLRRFSQTLVGLLALLIVASCAQDRTGPLEPEVQPSLAGSVGGAVGGTVDKVGGTVGGTVDGLGGTVGGTLDQAVGGVVNTANTLLLQCSPLPYSAVTKVIGPAGGTITVGPHTIVFPAGAVKTLTAITGEVISGRVNSVRFSPAGLEFPTGSRPQLTMSYANCVPLPLPKKIAYTTELLSILEVLESLDDAARMKVSARLDHFSRYAVGY
jgi:hypothetical protein